MRLLTLQFILGCMCVYGYSSAWAQEEAKPVQAESTVPKVTKERPISFWMAHKLDLSKSMIESLTKGDFEKLEKDSNQMRVLAKFEGFVRRKSESYRMQLQTFDVANAELIRQAQRKNSEGAVLAFNQLTNSCVACHILLREGVD
jgi:cytochrome c556